MVVLLLYEIEFVGLGISPYTRKPLAGTYCGAIQRSPSRIDEKDSGMEERGRRGKEGMGEKELGSGREGKRKKGEISLTSLNQNAAFVAGLVSLCFVCIIWSLFGCQLHMVPTNSAVLCHNACPSKNETKVRPQIFEQG